MQNLQVKKIKFFTLGCKANQYDTQLIREQCLEQGLSEASGGQEADYCIINTCSVTQRADGESVNLIRRAKRENPGARILVTGCLAESEQKRILNIDKKIILAKNKDKNRIANLLFGKAFGRIKKNIGISYFAHHTRAFLKIQDGCNYFCSFCKVPFVRGRSKSKPLSFILKEARSLAENGYQEIVLTGICLGAYGRDLSKRISLLEVLEKISTVEGIKRIRLSSIEMQDITTGLLDFMQSSKKLCPHLHIPLQSGDNSILKKMNRRYTIEDFKELVLRIKRMIPDFSLTTDVLVGFPGEKEAHFLNTLEAIKTLVPLKVHIFSYSKRPGTTAARLYKDGVCAKEIHRRYHLLRTAANESSLEFRQRFLGQRRPVLFEEEKNNFYYGYTDNYMRVKLDSEEDLKGKIIFVSLKKIKEDIVLAEF